MKNFYNLTLWQKAHTLVLKIYEISKTFPKQELYGMISQIRRASISITSNIAEGYNRYHYKEKIHFYYNARGSISELQNLLFMCKDIKYLSKEKFLELMEEINEILKLLNGLIRSLNKKINP